MNNSNNKAAQAQRVGTSWPDHPHTHTSMKKGSFEGTTIYDSLKLLLVCMLCHFTLTMCCVSIHQRNRQKQQCRKIVCPPQHTTRMRHLAGVCSATDKHTHTTFPHRYPALLFPTWAGIYNVSFGLKKIRNNHKKIKNSKHTPSASYSYTI